MFRSLILPLALVATPAFAAPFYRAEPAQAPAQERFVARDNIWTCGGGACVSARTGSRPAIVCAALARQVGELRSFSVEGQAFGAEELQGCNRRAR